MASATLREIYSNAPLLPPPAPVATVDEYGWLDDDPDLAPFLASTRTWQVRKETPLDAFF